MVNGIKTPDVLLPGSAARAVELLRSYYGIGEGKVAFTGAQFEIIGAEGNSPFAITPADLVALATLSVPVEGGAAVTLLSDEFQKKARSLLADISATATIADHDAATILAEEGASPAAQLWTLIANVKGMGKVSTSKLLARKRPALIPVYDTVIDAQLNLGGTSAQMWSKFVSWVNSPQEDGKTLIDHASDLKAQAGLPDYVTPLRVIDVVLWMDGKTTVKTSPEDER